MDGEQRDRGGEEDNDSDKNNGITGVQATERYGKYTCKQKWIRGGGVPHGGGRQGVECRQKCRVEQRGYQGIVDG